MMRKPYLIFLASLIFFSCAPSQSSETNDAILEKPSILDGLWYGNYTCGFSKPRLELDLLAFNGEYVKGLINFYNDPGLGNGTFVIGGSVRINGQILVKGTEWLQSSSGGQPFDLEGQVDRDLKTINGTVTSVNCSSFKVTRQ